VPIYYESRLAKLDINREPSTSIDYAGPRDRVNKDVEEVSRTRRMFPRGKAPRASGRSWWMNK
jgi:hypothetical protein